MPDRNDTPRSDHAAKRADDAMTERFLDDKERSSEAIVDAAQQAFDEDQRTDPDHPTRIKRELAAERGIEDPAHSRGSERGEPND